MLQILLTNHHNHYHSIIDTRSASTEMTIQMGAPALHTTMSPTVTGVFTILKWQTTDIWLLTVFISKKPYLMASEFSAKSVAYSK